MAEFEEIFEVLGEAEDGIAEEGEEAEELDPEESEELEEEVAEATESVSRLRSVADALRELSVSGVLKKFTVFIVKNAAIGAVCFGVNVVLKKLFVTGSGGNKKAIGQKLAKTKAISALITDISTISKTLTDWLKNHEDDTITIDSIEVPLSDIFFKYTKQMASVSYTNLWI